MNKTKECTCSNCGHTFVSSILFDFYPRPTKENPSAGLCENCFLKEALPKQTTVNISPVFIPSGYKETVCKMGKKEMTCSFLGFGEGGYLCLKKSSMEESIKERIRNNSISAKGDNCSGPPNFLKK